MKKRPKVCVIMATYNGEKYLREQIDSILAQKFVDLKLHIFDDVSSDNTVSIAKEYEAKSKKVIVHVNEKNKNITYNFLDALFSFKDDDSFDYYAFANQDDYWLESKLTSAVDKIKKTGNCTLYSSNIKLVNDELVPIGREMLDERYMPSHYDILHKNIVMGCTIVIDKEFKNLATKYYPENIYLYDYWLALISHFTKGAHYVYDNCPYWILFRQHSENVVGCSNPSKYRTLVKRVFSAKVDSEKSTQNLFKTYWNLYKDEVKDEDKSIIEKTANMNKFKNRLYLVSHVKTLNNREYFTNIIFNKY